MAEPHADRMDPCVLAMFVDFTVLVLTCIALLRAPGRSTLGKLIFQQGTCTFTTRVLWDVVLSECAGLVYFWVAFIANLIPGVFNLLNLNAVMNVMFAIPSIAASSTVACRCFVTLSSYAGKAKLVFCCYPSPWTSLLTTYP